MIYESAEMTVIAGYQIVVGIAMVGLWTVLLATRQVPEIPAGDREIWFHLAAELVTAALLIVAGAASLVDSAAKIPSAVALGALLYTTIASPGYYAERREWPPVILFGVLAISAVAAGTTLLMTVP